MFGALMLGLAIAFGLGGQAKILLEEQFRAKKKRDRRWELGIERCELTRAL